MRQIDRAHRWIERRKEHIGGDDIRLREPVEKGRLAGVRVADQRHHGIRHAFAALTMQPPRSLHLFEIALDPRDPLFDHPPIGFDLSLAWAAEKAKAAALPLEMRPGADQPALLVS